MLTKQDLNAIKSIIDERLESKLEEKLESKLEEKLESKLEEKLSPIHLDIIEIKKYVKKLKSDLKSTINYFDNRDNSLKSAINKTRKELNLEQFDFA